ncbi:MAG TPA: hypothetical protein VHD62_00495 [Opitutaceae bacterium]|nr:hypothetical protein [Opitutaceae bacterium]
MVFEGTNAQGNDLLTQVTAWLTSESSVESAVLFGSSVTSDRGADNGHDPFDLDLHLISTRPVCLERVDWTVALPQQEFCFQATRPATGGVRKTTVIFRLGQIDLVIVPFRTAWVARLMLRSKLYRRSRSATVGLNEMATCLRTGYYFLKGAHRWQSFYARVHHEMSGVRISNIEATQLANSAIIDYIWILKKVENGELIAAQHALHRQLSETNLRLYREHRLRRKLPLPSFGLGRRVESAAPQKYIDFLKLNSRLDRDELIRAANNAMAGLRDLMADIDPSWKLPSFLGNHFTEAIF